jgi:hypothetical protein
MTKIIESIINKDFSTASELLEDRVTNIVEKKLTEKKKMIMAEMYSGEGRLPSVKKLYRGLAEDDVDESLLKVSRKSMKLKTPIARANQSLEEEHSFVLKDKKTKEVVGTYKTMEDAASARTKKGGTKETHGIYKQRHAGALKNRMSEEASEESSMARSELQAITKDAKIIMSKIKGNKELEAWTQSKITKAADYMNAVADYMEGDKEETLEESRVNIVNLRVRGGKIQRRQKVSGVPGMTFRGGKLERMSAAERRRRKLGAMKAARKSKAKKSQTLRKRKISLMKRQRLGL